MRITINLYLVIILLFFYVGSATAQQPGSDGLGDSLYPQLGNGGYDVQHYDIDLRFTPENNYIAATTVIDAIATQDLSAFNLDLHGLNVESVSVNEAPAAFERDADELTITPQRALAADEQFTVAVTYAGIPEPISDPAVPFVNLGWQEWEEGYFAAVSQPSGSMNWYPCNNHPQDKATYTMRITVPEALTAAANGVLTDQIRNDDDTRTFVWQMDDPMASYLSIVVIGDYIEMRDDSGTIPIRNYFPADSDPTLISAYGVTQNMMAWLNELVGPYPFAEYGVVVVPGFPAALETQSLSIFGGQAPDMLVIMHELMHQWFGNSVTLAKWQDTWLHEGFATYFMALWAENLMGKPAIGQLISTFQMQARSLSAPGSVSQSQLFGQEVYMRGALVLHALRQQVGDDLFFDILRQFYSENAYGLVTSQDFIALAETVSEVNLDDFFAAWLYGDTLPELP